MTKIQGRAVLREGFRTGNTATVYRVVFEQTQDENEQVAVVDRIGHDKSSIKPIKSGKFPTAMERSTRIAHDISRDVVNQIESLTQAGKMDSDGLREILSQGLSDLKGAGISAPAEKLPSKPLPETAPAFWSKSLGMTPAAFIQEHYGEWVEAKSLGRADIHKLDPGLYTALSNWMRFNPLPDGMELPTVKQRTDRRVEEMRSALSASDNPDQLEEAARLSWALRNRNSRSRIRDR